MRIQFLLCLFGLVSPALGSVLAGTYQIVFYWYAYQLEIQAVSDPAARIIAPGCKGGAAGGTCYFDEFARWIQGSLVPWPPEASSGVGTNLNPDPETAAEGLGNAHYDTKNNWETLVPSKFAGLEKGPSLTTLLVPIMDVIRTSRVTLAAKGTDTSGIVAMLKSSMDSTVRFRIQDQAGASIKAFTTWCQTRSCSFDIAVKPVTNADGSSYSELDVETMIADNPDLKPKIIAGVQGFIKDFESNNVSGKFGHRGLAHFSAIQSCQGALSELSEAVPC